MSNMENLEAQLVEKERQQKVYDAAMSSVHQQRLDNEGAGLALMFAWDAFGETSQEGTLIGRAAKVAQMFCIGFAFVTPCLMFMAYAL